MFKRILVPIDGAEMSQKALLAAAEMAKLHGSQLVLLNVRLPFMPPAAVEVPIGFYSSADAYETEMKKQSDAMLAQAVETVGAGVQAKPVSTVDEHPYRSIIATAEEEGCDLILMASHGRRGMAGLILGSETQKVLTHCKVPVLVYR